MFATSGAARSPKKSRRFRACSFEQFESRKMLSAGPPTVVDVELSSSMWSAALLGNLQNARLGENGYSIPVGSSAQSRPLPWNSIDRIGIKFSEDVRIDSADLSLSGVNSINFAFADFHYDPQTRIAAWTLAQPLTKDRLRIDLNANGLTPIRDLDGNILDGEWANQLDTYPSGNGTAGGDFEFTLNILPADVNGSTVVEYADYSAVASLNGATVGEPEYNPFADLDGSATIDSYDSQAAMAGYASGDRLPNGLPAGTNNDAPTTKGFSLVKISDAAVDSAVALLTRFADIENGASGLAYSIVSNSRSSLFDYVYIDPATDKLIVNAAAGASGRGVVTIRATDSGGISTESNVTIDVNYTNMPPSLYVEPPQYGGENTWIIRGYVNDPDDDVSRLIVDFYGVFRTRAAVDEFGYFEFSVDVEPENWGDEFAITSDPHGFYSNQFAFEIRIT